MSEQSSLDVAAAHRFFSAQCFNLTWDLLDKPDRSLNDDVTMLLRSAASLWHWTQRPDCTGKNLSIGYWQLSRALALSGHGNLARQFATLSLEAAPEEDAFCRAYAYESLARAASILKEPGEVGRCMNEAQLQAQRVEDQEDRELIMADLRMIEGPKP